MIALQKLPSKHPYFVNSFLYKRLSIFFIKLFNWEYWSFNCIYMPIYFYWIYLCIKAKSLFFFSASNPTIENGGFLMEKKSDVYQLIPPEYYPKTILIKTGCTKNYIEDIINEHSFCFPLIIKPDIGGKGRGVKKVNSMHEAVAYLQRSNFAMLVQDLVPYKNEVGIFYYKLPWQQKGKISGIVYKEFLTVCGDGINTIEAILIKNNRGVIHLATLKNTNEINFSQVLDNGTEKVLVPFGNHARGCKFIDASHLITPALEDAIDNICKQINGFYYGRLDVMYKNWADMEEGKNISIIELNGAGSEPTHMYDPAHSIFFAWKEIIKHWILLYKISVYNKAKNNGSFLNFKAGIKMFRDAGSTEKKLDQLVYKNKFLR